MASAAALALLAIFAVGCGTASGSSSGSGAGADPPPSVGSLSASSGAIGSSITITGSDFGASQGTSTVTFNGVSAGTASAWSNTSITVTVPAGASTGDIVVTVNGNSSGGFPFQVVFTCATLPARGNEDALRGNFLVSFSGFADSLGTPAGTGPFQISGVFAANGSGGISGGEADLDFVYGYPGSLLNISGCYDLGSDQRGLMIWNFPTGGSFTFSFAMHSNGLGGRLILFEDFAAGGSSEFRGSGSFMLQSLGSFSESDLAGSYTFRLAGAQNASSSATANYQRQDLIGAITFAGSPLGGLGVADLAVVYAGASQMNFDGQPIYANPTAPDSLGRGTLSFEVGGSAGSSLCTSSGDICTYSLSYYVAGGGKIFLQGLGGSTTAGTVPAIFSGMAMQQSGTFNSAILDGTAVLTATGEDILHHGYTVEAAGQIGSNGTGSATAYLDKESNGNVLFVGTTEITGGSFAVNSDGLGTLTIGSGTTAQYFDVAMVTQNTGFVLEGTQANPGTNMMIGTIVPQTVTSILTAGFRFELAPVDPATTNVNVSAGSASTTVTTFTGTVDTSMGLACTTGCLAANQPFTGTYSIDPNGRITVGVTSAGGGTLYGWLASGSQFSGFIAQTSAAMTFFDQ